MDTLLIQVLLRALKDYQQTVDALTEQLAAASCRLEEERATPTQPDAR